MSDRRNEVIAALRSATLVGVIRAADEARARAAAEGLIDGGFRALEITVDTPGCLSILADLAQRTRTVTLGVGTVVDLQTLAAARAAGAAFAVSPHTDPALVKAAVASGLVSIPGAFSATEILGAMAAGADFVKLFPVSAGGGPRFLRALRGPLPKVPFWVSGDVAQDEIGGYLHAGATLIGLTSALTSGMEELAPADVRRTVAERATACFAAAAEARDEQVALTLVAGSRVVQVDLRDLRRLPGSEHVSIEGVIAGRRGHGVRVRRLLEHLDVEAPARLKLTSADGFDRIVEAADLHGGGVLQYAIDGRPLEADEGGPLRLYLIDGSDRCDNVKALRRIEVLET